ncbi:MAG: hypothetical protein PHG73_08930, partial [Pygmaiobacter sp.]|nr:hypothetical protein [Pygmaiobacter sp.]
MNFVVFSIFTQKSRRFTTPAQSVEEPGLRSSINRVLGVFQAKNSEYGARKTGSPFPFSQFF